MQIGIIGAGNLGLALRARPGRARAGQRRGRSSARGRSPTRSAAQAVASNAELAGAPTSSSSCHKPPQLEAVAAGDRPPSAGGIVSFVGATHRGRPARRLPGRPGRPRDAEHRVGGRRVGHRRRAARTRARRRSTRRPSRSSSASARSSPLPEAQMMLAQASLGRDARVRGADRRGARSTPPCATAWTPEPRPALVAGSMPGAAKVAGPRRRRHARRPPRPSPRPAGPRRRRSRRSRAAACAPRSSRGGRRDRGHRAMMGAVFILADARGQIADFLGALLLVYTLIIFVYIIRRSIFSFGVRVPYTRWSDAVLGLPARRLRAVPRTSSGGFIPPIGPLDLSPIVAILVLQIVGGHPRRPHRAGDAPPARWSARCVDRGASCWRPTRSPRRSRVDAVGARRRART